MKDYATVMMGVELVAMVIVPSMTNTIYNNTATVMHEVAAV